MSVKTDRSVIEKKSQLAIILGDCVISWAEDNCEKMKEGVIIGANEARVIIDAVILFSIATVEALVDEMDENYAKEVKARVCEKFNRGLSNT